MKSIIAVTIAVALSAAAAQAQFPQAGGFGGMGRGRGGEHDGGRGARGTPAAPPSRADVERQDPILVLMSNRAALALTDSEALRLEGLDAIVMEQNRPLLVQYDSLLALVPTSSDAGGGSDDAQTAATRAELFGVLRGVRANYRDAERSALALLAPDQRPKAAKLLDAQRPRERDLVQRRDSR